ncbi:aminoglycoside 6-adenylyltransferase [Paenibacillus alba]|uniref:Aminoglycoside 6-adenylyltransferase n=1 Tax=Paenibacillus alba TaxID=1197127 RepID=A0ABU6G0K0_9BACL|nr:aminoglycoside 6-adenylyltransferase [Paenibacillus alba]MEC0227174.1 aminoglycoside 6-adenylyltransferase [Paenibacillus alba]
MRNEKAVLAQLLDFANANSGIRAVLLNGSRVNPNVKKDVFCVTQEPELFLQDHFEKAVNEILWCSTNTGKGLWRDELPYAKYMFDVIVRKALCKRGGKCIRDWPADGLSDIWRLAYGAGMNGRLQQRMRMRFEMICLKPCN